MNCNAIQESLIDLLEGKLSNQKRQEVEKHIQHCESCQQDWREMQEVITLLENESDLIEEPDNFMGNVRQKVGRTQKKYKKSSKHRAMMGLAAGLFLTFFVGTAFATNGFTSLMDWWQDLSHKENEKIQKNVQQGLGENLN
ncbi:MAG TPA: zf-HC2 domain-containing protein, partial [Pseudoneobacillus sp.]|nr:zf-HC2 domain-containing protein [Pseudoneobacillus sp.]